jgi:plastocyanin
MKGKWFDARPRLVGAGRVLLMGILAVSLVGCGKKETAETTAPAPAAPAAAPVDPATAAAVTGTVKFEGAAPRAARINMAAEPACAKAHSGPVVSEEVVVGSGGALANVIVYVKEGLGNRRFDTAREPVVLDQHGCLYKPRVLAVMVNQPIEILNSDATTHNIHPVPVVNREWNKSQPAGSAKLVESFAREEVAIPVKCNVHPWMKSYIAVFRHPYHSVTAAAGSFELKNLPPGEYTLEAWHEKFGTAQQKVTLGAKETKAVEFVFKAASGD